jgi:predicted acetyltransferase
MPDEEKANPKRFVALELDGRCEAYAVYRQFPNFEDGIAKARLEVQDAVGTTPQATAEIWRFLLDIDWYGTLEIALLPPDHPLFLLLANPRRTRYRMGDSLWVRLVDVGAALSGRRYLGDGSVVVDVRDAVCDWNQGRWRVSADGAARTDDPAELGLDVSALGSAYLGAVSFGELWRAGRLEELADGAVARADALFAWRPLPWCPEIF